MDFKENGFMYGLAVVVVLFVIGQSIFFMVRAFRQGKKIGISVKTMRSVIMSSTLFTIAPAIAILATVVTLAGTLGIVLPWIRLTVVGNLQYEVTAAQAALESFKDGQSIAVFGQNIKDPRIFSAVSWVMTVGIIFGLILLPLVLKRLQNKIGKIRSETNDSRFGDIISAATFIGLVSAFIGNAIAGKAPTIKENGKILPVGMGAGIMSVAVLITSILVVVALQLLCKKFKWEKFEVFVLPIGMFAGMAMAILLSNVLPESISMLEWRPAT
ncbi:MAG: DUF5058 family protein [Clostridiales bacterium]|nr:DUF5058 family protein [Clostridiales bacterium]